jgi:transposase InsO family protein
VTNLHAKDAAIYPVCTLCSLFGVSKQAYYKYKGDALMAKIAREEIALRIVHKIRKNDSGIGGRKLWLMYCDEIKQNYIGRDAFEKLIARNGLKIRKSHHSIRTTDSSHGLPVYPNLIRAFIPSAPNQLWVSDITYIELWSDDKNYQFCYLSLILDAYTEEIVGWCVGNTLETKYPLAALRMALKRIKGLPNIILIHHSDRGCQYASREYTECLRKYGIRISMTESGDPKENAQAERINNTIKNELFKDRKFRNIHEVTAALEKAIYFYNNKRPHMSIDMLTPAKAAELNGEIKMKWKSYRRQAIKDKANVCEIPGKGLPLPISHEEGSIQAH